MNAKPVSLYDGHPDSPRLMYFTSTGERYTPEQWKMVQFMERIETKFDRLLELLEGRVDQQLGEKT